MISVMFGSAAPSAGCATVVEACGAEWVAPGRVAVAGPLLTDPSGRTVWFCLTLSRRPNPIADYNFLKPYFESTCFWVTPPAAAMLRQVVSWLSVGGVP